MAANSKQSWYYLDTDANATGPVSAAFILEKYHWKNGEITADSHVWEKDLVQQWSELRINYTVLIDDVIENIKNGEATKQLLQFTMNPYTIYMHWDNTIDNKKQNPMGQAKVEVEYKGYLATANSNKPNVPLQPFIQNRETIQLGLKKNAFGLEMALYHMSPGDHCRVYIPWRLAYGEKGAGNLIPPKCDVLFDLSMHRIVQQGAKWTIVKFDKWKKMKTKWNTQKLQSGTLFINSDFELIPYQNGKAGGSASGSKLGAGGNKSQASKPGLPPVPGVANNDSNMPLAEWLKTQKQLPQGLRDKFAELGITWEQLYTMKKLDNAEAKAKEWSFSVLYKIKLKGLLKKLPERPEDDDAKEKELPEMMVGVSLEVEGGDNTASATGPGMPPPAPIDATPGMWPPGSNSPSPKAGAGPGPGMPPPNPVQNAGAGPAPGGMPPPNPLEAAQGPPPPNPVMQSNHSYSATSPRQPPANPVLKQHQSQNFHRSNKTSNKTLKRKDSRPPPPGRRGKLKTASPARMKSLSAAADRPAPPPMKLMSESVTNLEYKSNDIGDTMDGSLKDDLNGLKGKLIDFGKKYTEKEIASMYNKDKNSILVEKEIDALEVKMKSTLDQLKRMKTQISKLKVSGGVDVSKYESWSIDEMVEWICSLDGGKFKKYADKIRKGFTQNEISGAHMTAMGSLDIQEVCGITHWKDRKDLASHFSSLKKK